MYTNMLMVSYQEKLKKTLSEKEYSTNTNLQNRINRDTKISLSCNGCSHIWTSCVKTILRRNSVCPSCACQPQGSLEHIKGIIYMAKSPKGKHYIGQTIQEFYKRKNSHAKSARYKSEPGYNGTFQRAIRKYGFDSFIWTILHKDVSWFNLDVLEKQEIKKYDSYRNGYNSTKGGQPQGSAAFKALQSAKCLTKKLASAKYQEKRRSIEERMKVRKEESANKKLERRKKKLLNSIARKLKSCLKAQRIEQEKLNAKETEHTRRSLSASRANALVKLQGKSSKYRGVTWEKRNKKYKANIKYKDIKVHIGMYVDELEAAKAYDAKAKELHGLKAKLNFPTIQ